MHQILPEPAEVTIAEAYASPRDWVRANMVSSIDGAATIHGRVGELTGETDQQVLTTLRMLADVVLVGAGTVRAEGYGPIEVDKTWLKRRKAAGQQPVPPLAVITNSGRILDAPIFDGEVPPIIITPESCPRREQLAERGRVLTIGTERVSVADAVAALRADGMRHILSEGGPRTLAELVDADLLDELCLTVSPLLFPGRATRITAGDAETATAMQLDHVYEEGGHLFLRYRRTR